MDALYYNGFKLAYRRYGASDAPAVVLIMGLGMSSAAWPTSLIAHLVREGFQVITPDNRDCGESSRCTDMRRTEETWPQPWRRRFCAER